MVCRGWRARSRGRVTGEPEGVQAHPPARLTGLKGEPDDKLPPRAPSPSTRHPHARTVARPASPVTARDPPLQPYPAPTRHRRGHRARTVRGGSRAARRGRLRPACGSRLDRGARVQRVRQLVLDHEGQPRVTPANNPCPPTAVTREVDGVQWAGFEAVASFDPMPPVKRHLVSGRFCRGYCVPQLSAGARRRTQPTVSVRGPESPPFPPGRATGALPRTAVGGRRQAQSTFHAGASATNSERLTRAPDGLRPRAWCTGW
jgi:hypothetical protein